MKTVKIINLKNKKARFEFVFIEEYVAGIKLKGTEIKSIRESKVSFSDSFCFFKDGEIFLKNLSISEYKNASGAQHEEKRERQLLLTKKELRKLEVKAQDKGLTIIPYRLFINDRGLAKVVIVLVKGKKLYDKRQAERNKFDKKEMSDLV